MNNENKNNNEYVDIDKEALSLATEICEKQQEILQLQRMQLIVQEYKNSTDMKLVEFAEKFLDGKNKDDNWSRFNLGAVTARQISDIQELLGFDVSDYQQVITANTIRHIENRHGKDGIQDKSMQNIEDIARVEYVLNNYDYVTFAKDNKLYRNADGKFADGVEYSKRINGTIYVVQAVPDSKNKTSYVQTMYIKKAEHEKHVLREEASSKCLPFEDVRNEVASPHSNSIPQNRKNVNRLKKKGNDDREL